MGARQRWKQNLQRRYAGLRRVLERHQIIDKVFTGVFAAFSPLFLVLSCQIALEEIERSRDGVEVSGEVVDVYRSGKVEHATVVFTTKEGRKVRANMSNAADRAEVGDVIRVRYLPANPDSAVNAEGEFSIRALTWSDRSLLGWYLL